MDGCQLSNFSGEYRSCRSPQRESIHLHANTSQFVRLTAHHPSSHDQCRAVLQWLAVMQKNVQSAVLIALFYSSISLFRPLVQICIQANKMLINLKNIKTNGQAPPQTDVTKRSGLQPTRRAEREVWIRLNPNVDGDIDSDVLSLCI